MTGKCLLHPCILHVDDDPSFLDLASSMLERPSDHLTIVSETSAANGLGRLNDDSKEFECILSDYDMPQMNGLEFLMAVNSEFPDLPFVLLTVNVSEEIASRAISVGVSD